MTQVVHVVLVEWAEGRDGAAEEAEGLVDQHLRGIPGVLSVDRGPSVSTEGLESGFDWALVIRFESADAVAAYLPHPDHVVVGRYLGDNSARVVVFDVAS
ncbi:Dabb family protein [Amnibacterium setariae]|nr:Dabb family protein [Amnibacterium setariae]